MAFAGAEGVAGDFDEVFLFGGGGVFGAGAVADFALHRREVFDVGDSGAAGLAVAGDVAADAVEVELFVLAGERGVSGGVRGLIPELAL